MMRYLRLYGACVRFSLSKSMEFRMDFFFRIVMDMVYYAVNIGFFEVLYLHFGDLGGWDRSQMRLFVASYIMIDAIQMTLYSNNLWNLPMMINRGDLDYYLLRPVSTLFFVSMRDFAVNSFINFLMTVGFMVYVIANYPGGLSAGAILLLVFLILNGSFLFLAVQVLLLVPIFWTHSSQGFREVGFALGKVMERPHKIFPPPVRWIFTYVLPYTLMASVPAQIVIENGGAAQVALVLGVTAVFWMVVIRLWRLGLRNYSSASS